MPLPPLPYRLTIGVTGHRTLTHPKELRVAVAQVLEDIRTRVTPPAATLAFAVLSPLAEGADRLVAEVCLDQLPDCLLKVVLPLPLDD